MQHIKEANDLSQELGGTDKDVKNYFFSLPPAAIAQVLDLYERKYEAANPGCRAYAEATLPRWRSGAVKMSGMVATRLFNLLPPIMPLEQKYMLVESLWRHVGPSSKRLLRVGLDANQDAVLGKIREHIDGVVSHHIPEPMTKRFDWLSAGDVSVKQSLLNHVQSLEKSMVIEAARQQLPVMLDHLRSEAGANTHRLAQILRVGKHELEVRLDRAATGVTLESWAPQSTKAKSGDLTWLWWLLGIAAVIGFFMLKK